MIDIEDFIRAKIKNEAKKKYHRDYMRDYNKISARKRYKKEILVEYIKPPEVDEERLDIHVMNCSHFGCPKILTMQEKLFGNKCTKHSGKSKEIVSKK